MIYFFFALAVALGLYIHLGPKLKNMQEGMWEITIETKMPGMEMAIPERHSQCLTKDEPVPQVSIPNYECRLMRRRYPFHVIGNYVLWKIHCEGPGDIIQGAGHIKYSGDSLKGKMQMRTIEDEGQKRFDAHISGFRTGDCR